VIDRWLNNAFIRDPLSRPEPPRARWIKRKPVSVRALHRVKPDPIFGFDPPDYDPPECLDPAWSIAQSITYWQERL
jgi:hypothetical protein